MTVIESIVEDVALEWLGMLGYAVGHGPNLARDERMLKPPPAIEAMCHFGHEFLFKRKPVQPLSTLPKAFIFNDLPI